jgi:hypothetical protein
MGKSRLFELLRRPRAHVLALLIVSGAAHCTYDFDHFEPPATSPAQAGNAGQQGSVSDAAAGSASVDQSSGAGGSATGGSATNGPEAGPTADVTISDATAPPDVLVEASPASDGGCGSACIATAKMCATDCNTAQQKCLDPCMRSQCRTMCMATHTTCLIGCAATCQTCTRDANCPQNAMCTAVAM